MAKVRRPPAIAGTTGKRLSVGVRALRASSGGMSHPCSSGVLRCGGCHEIEQITFLVAGLLFWRPVIQRWSTTVARQWSIPVYLFLATLPCDALAAFLTFCGRAVYPALYGPAGVSAALLDQEVAGSLMWVWVTFVYLLPAVVITIQGLGGREPSIDL
jgi:cytochrome c oxidase assembly factor CtaG